MFAIVLQYVYVQCNVLQYIRTAHGRGAPLGHTGCSTCVGWWLAGGGAVRAVRCAADMYAQCDMVHLWLQVLLCGVCSVVCRCIYRRSVASAVCDMYGAYGCGDAAGFWGDQNLVYYAIALAVLPLIPFTW